jgi:hypothetical protein
LIVFGIKYFFDNQTVEEVDTKLTAEQMLEALNNLPKSASENKISKEQMIDALKNLPENTETENKITREQMLEVLSNNN